MDVVVLGQTLALVLGFISLGMIPWVRGRKTARRLIWMPATLVAYNVWVALFLASSYVGGRLVPRNGRLYLSAEALAVALIALVVVWGCTHLQQIFSLVGLPVPKRVFRLVSGFVLTVAMLTAISWFLVIRLESPLPLAIVGALARLIVFAISLYSSAWLYVKSRALDDPVWGRKLMILAAAYVAVFLALITVSLAWSSLSQMSRTLAPLLDLVIEISYNLVVVVWLAPLVGWSDHGSSPPDLDNAVVGVADVTCGRGITKRENEIIALICEGKTNQEIADQLFISVTTVKDHNQAIFQKLGVRNRTEVTRLILRGSSLQK
jgi:DNA-binding CsgD family transcriptional regulator